MGAQCALKNLWKNSAISNVCTIAPFLDIRALCGSDWTNIGKKSVMPNVYLGTRLGTSNFFLTLLLAPYGPLYKKKFQKTLILAFEANSADCWVVPSNCTFFGY